MIYFGCLTEWLRLCTSVTAVVAGKTAKMQGEAAYTWWKGNIRFHELWKRTKLYFEYRCKLVFIQMRGYRKYKALGKLLQGPLNCSEAFKLSPGYKGPVPLRKKIHLTQEAELLLVMFLVVGTPRQHYLKLLNFLT